MHQAQVYFNSNVVPIGIVQPWNTLVINPAQAGLMRAELFCDAWSYLYSAAVSIGDATKGIQGELFSWAAVKLYYAAFYALRAHLASASHAILYQKTTTGGTPFVLNCFPGESPKKLSGTTHKVVLAEFAKVFPSSSAITQEIVGAKPLDWLIERREEANYKNGCFPEPTMPTSFNGVTKLPIRLTLSAYIGKDSEIYAFDPDHSILALPMLIFQKSLEALMVANPLGGFSTDQIDFLKNIFRDKHGEIKVMTSLFPQL